MSKKYTNAELREILKNIMNIGYSSISAFSKELMALNLTQEEMKENKADNKRLQDANLIISVMTIISDIIHPGFNISKQLLPPTAEPFILNVIKQHEAAKKNGVAAKGCACCKPEVKAEENLSDKPKEI